ncbi:hypothetical protein K458DRAFT_356325 [Lentithecium fluviatile CBS 122367]|uniref:Reverse transcriptase domain-containing protein n=1 Tax=Lentithecium fluviatile CBS 122367 TaxID=1168545 RepID=A0A6G1JHC0_9PLEO|nr:hypothetical protein K458DRAFT_356325 [Lentithecium fluviatile CBS 122367]
MTSRLPPIAISPVVREAVTLKAGELAGAKAAFKNRYDGETTETNTIARLDALLERIKELDPNLGHDDDLDILKRVVEQARNDHSVSETKLLRLEKDLKGKLEKHANRLEVSSLHVELLKEALAHGDDDTASLATKVNTATLEDGFEIVDDGLEDNLDNFEKYAFKAKNVDTAAIEAYLEALFENPAAKTQLGQIRENMKTYGDGLMMDEAGVDEDMLTWCIADLLQNPLLSPNKKETLEEYLQSPLAVRELAGTLSMKSVQHWNWRNADKGGLPVTARHNGEGIYCIAVEEDVIDMLFLHCLAVGWSLTLMECLSNAVLSKGLWPGNRPLTTNEQEKREYYILAPRPKETKSCSTCHPPPPPIPYCGTMPLPRRRGGPPPPPLPPPSTAWMSKARNKASRYPCPPPPPSSPPASLQELNDGRYRNYMKHFFLSRLPTFDGQPERTSQEETQAILLKTLATELRVREAFDGSAHGMTANFEAFATSLPHTTILTVLKFLGVPDRWLETFTHFLAAPLNMGPLVRGTSDQVLIRKCGVPVAHGLELFFSEALLFFLDLAVHQKTNTYLFRLRDKCYSVGTEDQRNHTIREIELFANTMGLTAYTHNYLDAQPISFLQVSAKPISFTLDNKKIEAYAHRVKEQLAAAPTVLSWIHTWNATIGTYQPHLFGPLANVFGKAHLAAVTQAYNTIHAVLFPDSNLTAHIASLLLCHLNGPKHLPDLPSALEPLIYLPHAYGGLGVKNPYVTLNLARDMLEDPQAELMRYLEAEKKHYDTALKNFIAMSSAAKAEKLKQIFGEDTERIASIFEASPSSFPSFKSFTQDRERAAYPPTPTPPSHPHLLSTYTFLLATPTDIRTMTHDKIADEVMRLSLKRGMKRLNKLSEEDRWTLQLYGEECFERYGGLEVWVGESVPREVLKVVRGEVGVAELRREEGEMDGMNY